MPLVGPDAMANTGKRAAKPSSIRVPSFWLRYSGAVNPRDFNACLMAPIDISPTLPRQALSVAAFSRSRIPIRPFS